MAIGRGLGVLLGPCLAAACVKYRYVERTVAGSLILSGLTLEIDYIYISVWQLVNITSFKYLRTGSKIKPSDWLVLIDNRRT